MRSILSLSLAVLAVQTALSSSAHAGPYQCGKWTQPERQVQKLPACDDTAGFGLLTPAALARPELSALFAGVTEKDLATNEQLRNLALEARFRMTSNMNAATFTFPSGVTRTVFRGAYHAPEFSPNSVLKQAPGESDHKVACMKDLVEKEGLAKIVNYDELDWESAIHLTNEEKALFSSLNPQGDYWEFTPANGRTFQYKFNKGKGTTPAEKKRDVMGMVASIVREIEGDPLKPGSVYIHCYGGHHRTGTVWGVLQKCIGHMPVDDIIAEYKCHIGYESPQNPGGYHPDNEALIREFPCEEYFGAKSATPAAK